MISAVLYHMPVFSFYDGYSMHGHFSEDNVHSQSGRRLSLVTIKEGAEIPIIGWIGHRPIGGDYVFPEDYDFSVSSKYPVHTHSTIDSVYHISK